MEVTIEITQYCDADPPCDYCSSNASKSGEPTPIEVIERFLNEIQDKEMTDLPLNVVTRINISGGEPLSHPQFYRILKKCYSITPDVWVYTNALRNIIYNSDVVQEIIVKANVVVFPGWHYFPESVSETHILKPIYQGRAKNLPKTDITVSRNFYDPTQCDACEHILLQADGHVVTAPCKKEYPD